MSKITVLVLIDRLACFHSLKPFLLYGGPRRFDFTDSADYCLGKDRNDTLIMVRQFIKPDVVDTVLLTRLREKYRRIAFFHDDAGGGIPRLQILPHVDLFYSKALFKDRSIYKRPLYGKELYSDYYHIKYGVKDPNPIDRVIMDDEAQLAKLRLSWNVGIGDYPRGKLRQRIGTAAARVFGPLVSTAFYSRKSLPADPVSVNRGLFDVHARIALVSRPSIAYQRKLVLERISGHPRFLVGFVSQKKFNFEVAHSKIILSPFGWGELCLRDYEAVLNGALLLKPDMAHLETWPDIFHPEQTYVPFDWDATDLVVKAERYLEDASGRKRIARAAFETLHAQLDELSTRFEATIAEIEGN